MNHPVPYTFGCSEPAKDYSALNEAQLGHERWVKL